MPKKHENGNVRDDLKYNCKFKGYCNISTSSAAAITPGKHGSEIQSSLPCVRKWTNKLFLYHLNTVSQKCFINILKILWL